MVKKLDPVLMSLLDQIVAQDVIGKMDKEEPKAAMSVEELASLGKRAHGAIKWLTFLFLAEGLNREADYNWRDRQYFGWFWKKILLYIILYPIMSIWSGWRGLKGKA